jgi:tetratricopeptide (TPR) repeat protein
MLRTQEALCLSENKKRIKNFTNAGYQMIQNLPEEAIKTLNFLIDSETSEDFLYKFFTFRAFCFFSIENYAKAQEDYEKAEKIKVLDSASATNLYLSRVTQVFLSGDYEKCEKMIEIKPSSPSMLKVIYLQINLFKKSTIVDPKRLEELIKTSKTLQSDNELLKILSFFYYCLKDFNMSLKKLKKLSVKTDISKIIESFNCISLQSYQEAEEILSSVNLESSNNKFAIYPYRALSSAYLQKRSNSLQDIYKIINENSYQAYLLSIYLLIIANEINEALLVISITEKTTEVLLLQAHCFLINFDLEKSEEVLKKIELKSVKNDLKVVQGIRSGKLLTNDPGVIFNERYVLWIQGIHRFYEEDYSNAVQVFENALNLLQETQTGQFFLFNPGYLLEYSLIIFNIVLCLIGKADPVSFNQISLKAARNLLKESIKLQKSSYSEQVLLYFLLKTDGKSLKAEKKLNEIHSNSKKTYEKILNSKEISIFPEYSNWKLKSVLPSVNLKPFPTLQVSPSFIFPVMQPPLDFKDSCFVIQKLFQKLRPKPRPEVPWLEKIGNTYKFTDSLIAEV